MEEKNTQPAFRPSRRIAQLMLITFLLFGALPLWAQNTVSVRGSVTSGTDGLPLIGVNVTEKGTTNGIVTDYDGNYQLEVPVGATLHFSYIGYIPQEVAITAGKQVYNIVLKEDSKSLDEVVVMGYGVQKKKLVTGATVQVGGDDVAKLSSVSVLGALQSQTPGVNITQSSGQPGDGFKVTIRGLGTVGNSSPLYVIDGVAGADINNLNPSDIESIDVLKDAASAAIYGARAANGVILVTTKQGKRGPGKEKTSLSYDGYVGWQYCYKMPDMLNAQEYMSMVDEIRFNEGNPTYDWASLLPGHLYEGITNGTWKGTDWMKESYNKAAPVQNHAINLTGASELSTFSMGFSYTKQDGIFGKPVESNYDRYTARVNSDHILLKLNDLETIKIGETLNYKYSERGGIATGNLYWNDIHNLLVANPLLPAYDSEGNYYDYDDKVSDGWNFDGNAANPIIESAYSTRGLNKNKNHDLLASAYLQIQPIRNLFLKSQFGYKMSASSSRSMDKIHHTNNNTNVTSETVNQSAGSGYSWTLDNTISYRFEKNRHNADFVLGQSAEKWGMGENVNATGMNTIFLGSWANAWLDNTNPTSITQMSIGGAPWGNGSLASFFGRANYNYNETYMASFTLRADGSSNFSRGNRWGYFPSVSAGWVMTNEKFMDDTKTWLDFFKLRASWGQNGNCNIDGFQYLTTFSFDDKNVYYFGNGKTEATTGGYADILKNPNISWEKSEQWNIGLDARFLSSRLGLNVDYYNKKTKDWLVQAPILGTYGLTAPFINGGDVSNKGVEVNLNWNDNIADFTYSVNVNMAYNKNEVTKIANSEGIIHGDANVLSQGTTEMYRAQVGYPIGYFYGYKTAGVFQNWDQVNNAAAKYASAKPGDLIFVDTDGNGLITEDDRTMIGNPHPDYTVGGSIILGYKGFDFAVTLAGAFGHQIAKSYRSFADSPLQNYTTDIFDRWTGEGTSNRLPILTSGSNVNWQNISDIYIEDGDYMKVKNLTIGYDFKTLFPKMPLSQARLYFTAQNLWTITKYSGMDPEIGYGYDKSWVSGIDLGFYPSPRTYLIGVNLKF